MSAFVADELSEVLKTKVVIGRINMGLLNRIIIDDVLLDDQSGQEMLKVTRLSAKFDIVPFFKGKISISSVQLFGFNINLRKETPDTPPNFKFVLDAFASKDTVKKESSLDLRINSILIRRGRMSYHVLSEEETPGKFNAKHIQLQNIIANISLKALSKDSVNLGIKRLSLDEKMSGFSLKKMSLKLVANNKQTSIDNPIGFSNSVGTLILSDNLYQKMRDSTIDRVTVISINGEKMRSNETAYTALNASMPDNIYLASAWQRESTFVRDASSTFLLICFTTIIFLIATGSILYFQNISSVTYDKPDYEIMLKMGYSHTMIKKCVRRQIQIYYGIPYVIGLLHSIFAMICYKSALMDDLLGRNSAVVAPILLAVAIFSIIYVIYYQLTKRSCYIIALK